MDTKDGGHENSLAAQHAVWDERLREEMNRPSPDTQRIQLCKKHKLRLKDEMRNPNSPAPGEQEVDDIAPAFDEQQESPMPERPSVATNDDEPLLEVAGGFASQAATG